MTEKDLARFPDSRRIFQNNGHGWRPGDVFKQPELARTLERIAAAPDDFYRGRMAQEIAEFMRRGGGLITTEDLANYEVKDRDAGARYLPRGGNHQRAAAVLGRRCAALSHSISWSDLISAQAGLGSARSVHLIAESYRRAFFDRAQFMGDPDFTAVPVAQLMDKGYALAWSKSIERRASQRQLEAGAPVEVSRVGSLRARTSASWARRLEPHHTTHYSVVDADGNAVAVTTTLNDDYGSRVTIGSLGFLLNNEMDDFAAKPGVPNIYGLIQGAANAVGPNKRPLSAMTPTIVLKDGKLWLVLGAEGGPTIITSVANILIGVRDYGLDIQEAVNAPRIHQQWLPDRVELEKGRFSPDTIRLLAGRG